MFKRLLIACYFWGYFSHFLLVFTWQMRIFGVKKEAFGGMMRGEKRDILL
jgi:hypothetical protein